MMCDWFSHTPQHKTKSNEQHNNKRERGKQVDDEERPKTSSMTGGDDFLFNI
jgi:hypothetical protein